MIDKTANFKIKMRSYAGFLLMFCAAVFLVQESYSQLPITTDSRIRTLVYNPNEVYEVKFYYNYQSFIEFSEDEEIEMISVGEAFAWRLTPAGKRLFIRPLEIAAHTNMTIITNKRTYYFDIRSSEFTGKADEDLVYTIRFFYPQIGQPLPIPPQLASPNFAAKEVKKFMPIPSAPPAPEIQQKIKTAFPGARIDEDLPDIIERNPESAPLNFDYSMVGNAKDVNLLKVYDNGMDTRFQFSNDNAVVPTISLVDMGGGEQRLTHSIQDDYVIVPATGAQFTLRLGNSLLCVYNNSLIKNSR